MFARVYENPSTILTCIYMVSIFLEQTKGGAFDSLKEQILLTSLSKKCPVFPKTQKVGGFSDLPGSSREFTFCKT